MNELIVTDKRSDHKLTHVIKHNSKLHARRAALYATEHKEPVVTTKHKQHMDYSTGV